MAWTTLVLLVTSLPGQVPSPAPLRADASRIVPAKDKDDAEMANLTEKTIEYEHAGKTYKGYFVHDSQIGDAKRPGVLVVHEWWGLNDFAKDRARELAKMGYVAFAVDMFGEGKTTTDRQVAANWAGSLRGTPEIREVAKAGLQVLARQPEADPNRIGAIGFCFGGTTVLELAFSGADVGAVVSFHGGLVSPKPSDGPFKARVLACHGADDPFVPPEVVASFQQGATQSGIDWQFISYSGAVHSFTNPMAGKANIEGSKHHAEAARRSWQHMKLFFDDVLGPPTNLGLGK